MSSENSWTIAWSHEFENNISALGIDMNGAIVLSDDKVYAFDPNGSQICSTRLRASTYSVSISEGIVAILSGPDLWFLSRENLDSVFEPRRVPGGFHSVIPRVGGGWVAADRGDHIHLFSERGRGLRRIRSGAVRRLLGWFDREHLLLQGLDGRLSCICVTGRGRKRTVDERPWSYASLLHDGACLVESIDGALHIGVPDPFGWSRFDLASPPGVLEPSSSAPCVDGWLVVDLSGEVHLAPITENPSPIVQKADLIASDGQYAAGVGNRSGLFRWIDAPVASHQRGIDLRKRAAEAREKSDWDQRESLFEKARDAEDGGAITRAIELYRALGRDEDVRRLLAVQEEDR